MKKLFSSVTQRRSGCRLPLLALLPWSIRCGRNELKTSSGYQELYITNSYFKTESSTQRALAGCDPSQGCRPEERFSHMLLPQRGVRHRPFPRVLQDHAATEEVAVHQAVREYLHWRQQYVPHLVKPPSRRHLTLKARSIRQREVENLANNTHDTALAVFREDDLEDAWLAGGQVDWDDLRHRSQKHHPRRFLAVTQRKGPADSQGGQEQDPKDWQRLRQQVRNEEQPDCYCYRKHYEEALGPAQIKPPL